jgi:hypothetical protein
MRRFNTILVAGVAAIALAAAPALAQQQGQASERGGGGRPSGGQAVARPAGGGSSGGAPPPSTSAPRGGSPAPYNPPTADGAGARDRGPRSIGRAVPRSGGYVPSRTEGSSRTTGVAGGTTNDGRAHEMPAYSRWRGSQPALGTAVPRGNQPIVRPGTYYYNPYGYYPYGYGYPYYGSFGLGLFYYDPYWWGYPTYGYGYGSGYGYGYDYGYGSGQYADTGALRLKVKPRQAQVFVDGYFVGVVDQFDGIFQRLRLGTGGHRVEVRLDGYTSLSFDVLIPPGETITYQGELKKLP